MIGARARYLLAMGALPAATVAAGACSRTAGQNIEAARPDDGTTPVAATPTTESASGSVALSSIPVADASTTLGARASPPNDAGVLPATIIRRYDAGGGVWSIAEEQRTPHPQLDHMPMCPSGNVCIASTARTDAGTAARSKRAAPPYADCAETIPHHGLVTFRPDLTTRERSTNAGACCYSWVEPCPGGRPLRDEAGALIVANDVAREDFCADLSTAEVSTAHLEDDRTTRLERHWLDAAAAEHASVASFSRFSMQLLALGAPRELLALTHRAALDEIRHAEFCFGLAARASGQKRGPGVLSLPAEAHARAFDPITVTMETLRDGCLGESLAACGAAEAARSAVDPRVQSALLEIARDEEAHAELAWRTIAWLLDHHGAPVRAVIESFLDDLRAKPRPRCPETDPDLSEHGVLTKSKLASVEEDVLSGIVIPCAEGLLASRPSPPLERRSACRGNEL